MPARLADQIAVLYDRLLVIDVCRQLPGHTISEQEPLCDLDYRRLMAAASWLALSEDNADRTAAYEIATRIVELTQRADDRLVQAASAILSRLGNFPGRTLLRKRYAAPGGNIELSPVYLALETIARECENTVEVVPGRSFPLTDFQKDLFDDLANTPALSVSAPTSAGKSFVLCLDVIRRLRTRTPCSIVFVVPTRALIRQVAAAILKELHDADLQDVPVRCVPLPIERTQAPHGVVYVLTQERLLSLLFSDQGQPWITALIVDEAQGVKDGSRGVLLQSAVEEVQRRFPATEIVFSSPMVRNPEYLLFLFSMRDKGRFLREEHSPVSQNLILLSEVPRRLNQIKCELLVDTRRIELGTRELDFPFRAGGGTFKLRARLSKAVTAPDDCTILYANYPKHTEDLADELVSEDLRQAADDPDLSEFVEFLRDHVHPEYPLIRHLPYRVAYHYGFMPSIVRTRVEELFQSGKLRFICCTSTLLQGVNLPAKNIVIDNPRKGRGRPMQRADFLNLAGRAGRLLEEFHGNVWCIRPDGWDTPDGADEPCFRGDLLQQISSAFDKVLEDGGTLVQRLLTRELLPDDDRELATAALGKVFADFTQSHLPLEESRYSNDTNRPALAEVANLCANIRVTLPPSVFRRNSTIAPDRLQRLYEYLDQQPPVEQWLPLMPHEIGFNDRMRNIFQIEERFLADIQNRSYEFDAWLASQWIHDQPLRWIIDNQISRRRTQISRRRESPRDVIYDLLEALENRIRFRYVKHTRAYQDVLSVLLRKAGRSDLIPAIRPLDLFLECGASSAVALSLMSLGLSRTTALLLKGQIRFPVDATPEGCIEVLRRSDIRNLRIPELCKREIFSIIGMPM